MEVSGHRNMAQVAAYIEVCDEQVLGVVNSPNMLYPVAQTEAKSEVESDSGKDRNLIMTCFWNQLQKNISIE